MISDSSVRTHRTHNFSKRMPFWNSECRSAEMLSLKHTRIFWAEATGRTCCSRFRIVTVNADSFNIGWMKVWRRRAIAGDCWWWLSIAVTPVGCCWMLSANESSLLWTWCDQVHKVVSWSSCPICCRVPIAQTDPLFSQYRKNHGRVSFQRRSGLTRVRSAFFPHSWTRPQLQGLCWKSVRTATLPASILTVDLASRYQSLPVMCEASKRQQMEASAAQKAHSFAALPTVLQNISDIFKLIFEVWLSESDLSGLSIFSSLFEMSHVEKISQDLARFCNM